MASLVANKEQNEILFRKFFKHQKAKRILNDIEKINPELYPVPTSS